MAQQARRRANQLQFCARRRAKKAPNRVRAKVDFLRQFKLIGVSSPDAKKSLSENRKLWYLAPSRPTKRGVGHRHERWGGMRWTRQRRKTSGADPPSLKLRRTGTRSVEWLFRKAGRGRRNRVVLSSRRWSQVCDKKRRRRWQKSRSPGRARIKL
jgi:hypothetical protein